MLFHTVMNFYTARGFFSAVAFFLYCLASYCNSFIIPNELPSILSVIYSNIPPVKVGIDTRLGWGFRLGPHADYQTLIEIGPQTNTNPISTNGTVAKRQSDTPRRTHRLFNSTKNVTAKPVKLSRKESKEKKSEKTLVGKIEFKKVPGIDEMNEKTKKPEVSSKTEKVESSPTKFVLL